MSSSAKAGSGGGFGFGGGGGGAAMLLGLVFSRFGIGGVVVLLLVMFFFGGFGSLTAAAASRRWAAARGRPASGPDLRLRAEHSVRLPDAGLDRGPVDGAVPGAGPALRRAAGW